MIPVEALIVDPVTPPEEPISPPLVCDLSAIDGTGRIRHKDLLLRLRAAQRDRLELSDGYSFRIDHEAMSLTDVAEWMDLERLCCPFLTLMLQVCSGQDDSWLAITGPAGAKPIIEAELTAPYM